MKTTYQTVFKNGSFFLLHNLKQQIQVWQEIDINFY